MDAAKRLQMMLNPKDDEEQQHVNKMITVLGDTLLITLVAMINRESSRPIEIVQVVDDDPEVPDNWHEEG